MLCWAELSRFIMAITGSKEMVIKFKLDQDTEFTGPAGHHIKVSSSLHLQV